MSSKKLPEPVPDVEHEYDVTIRVRARGKSEQLQPAIRTAIERELPFLFPDAAIRRIRRASR